MNKYGKGKLHSFETKIDAQGCNISFDIFESRCLTICRFFFTKKSVLNSSLETNNESKEVSVSAIFAQQMAKIAPQKKIRVCSVWSLQTSLLSIVGELAKGGCVALIVGVSER